MDTQQLIDALLAMQKEHGVQPVLINDSHCNTSAIASIKFIRYAHPCVLLETEA